MAEEQSAKYLEELAKPKTDSEDTKLLDNLFGAVKAFIARFSK